MTIVYFNGKYLPKSEIRISPDDRGFLFADGIYEVVKWYERFFYDMENHVARLQRSLREVRIRWAEEDTFPLFAEELIIRNKLHDRQAFIYLQVTRGVAPRSHSFPNPEVSPTIYAYVKELVPTGTENLPAVKVWLTRDIRWHRCDIKSVSLLPNTIGFQEAVDNGCSECIFVRDGLITEGSHSNIFFVIDSALYTHPESDNILSGVTRKNVLRIARANGIPVHEEPLPERSLNFVNEAFITSTTLELTPVKEVNDMKIGNRAAGPVTKLIHQQFHSEISSFKAK